MINIETMLLGICEKHNFMDLFSMVFLAQKIRRKFAGSPTFVILTDREEKAV